MLLRRNNGNKNLLERPWKTFPAAVVLAMSVLLLESGQRANDFRMASVAAFSVCPTSPTHSYLTNHIATMTLSSRRPRSRDWSLFFSPNGDNDNNNNNDNEKNNPKNKNNDNIEKDGWLERRLQKANFLEIRRDAVLQCGRK